MIRCLSILLAGQMFAFGQAFSVPRSYFQDEDFVKAFVGSYGFLPAVEPKVDREEAELLAEISEWFGEGRFLDAEARIVDFVKARKYPQNPEDTPKEISPALVFALGNLYLQSNRMEDAERAYKLCIDKFPKFRRAHKNLALLYAIRDKLDLAMPHLKKAVELGDSDHKTFGLLGLGYLKGERPLAAEGAYRQAYLLAPGEKDWKLGLAQSLLLQEKWAESAAMLGELIADNPENPDLWKQQANCYLGMNERLKAAANFEVMRLKGIANADNLNLLGDIYADQEMTLLAQGAYLAALALDDTVDIRRSIKTAKILTDFEAPAEAEEFLNAVREKAGDSLRVDQQVDMKLVDVDIARSRGETEREGQLLDEISKLDPMNGEGLVLHGQYFETRMKDAGDDEEAAKCEAKARSKFKLAMNNKDPEVQYLANRSYGQMLVRQKDYQQGLGFIETALKLKPNDSLKRYSRQVSRAARRQQEREEREAAEAEDFKKEMEESEKKLKASEAEAS